MTATSAVVGGSSEEELTSRSAVIRGASPNSSHAPEPGASFATRAEAGTALVPVEQRAARADDGGISLAARYYVGAVVLLGCGLLAQSLIHLRVGDLVDAWPFILGSCLGSAARVSLRPFARNAWAVTRGATMSVGFAFTFATILFAGVPVGVLTALLTGLSAPLVQRRRRPLYQTVFNAASLVLSTWASGMVYFRIAHLPWEFRPTSSPLTLLFPVMVATYVYYLVNTWSVAIIVAMVQKASAISTWVQTFLWTAPGYFIGGAAAVVTVAYYGTYGQWVFLATIPAIVLTHCSYRSYIDKVQETQQRYNEVQRLYQESLQLVSQSEKMASIGTLAGGIAHEINNPLMVILGRTELVMGDLPEDHPCVQDLKVIEEETRRIASIVGELLRFARRDNSLELLPVDINEVIRRSLQLIQYQLRVDNVEVHDDLADFLPTVAGNAGRLQQVMTNIFVNAYHSMRPAGGRLTIRTWADDLKVYTEIRDTGSGIPPNVLSRVFEPFYTTKSEQEGTGLGLAVSYGIIKEHHGAIEVESEEGKGAMFRVSLPRRDTAG